MGFDTPKNVDFSFDKIVAFALIIGGGVFWIIIAALSEGCPMGGDAFEHFKFSRYAFDYPEHFLHHWGKPLYTLLSSPFSQLGYFGARLFNVLLAVASSYFTYRIAALLKLNLKPVVVIMVLFTPYYTLIMLSAMTEMLFSFLIILSVFLFLDKRFFASAIVVSFLPFVRTEGFGIIPVFLVVYMLTKNWKVIPFLISGTLIYSIIGYFYFGDFFWIFTQLPYSKRGSELYGSGEFLFYFNHGKLIFGWLIFYLLGIGGIAMIYRLIKSLIKSINLIKNDEVNAFILIFGIFFGYVFMQSFLWYKGLMGVLASPRFIVSVIPLGAIIALYGINILPKNLLRHKWFSVGLFFLIGYFVIVTPFRLFRFPWGYHATQLVIKNTADWIKAAGLDGNKIVYYDPAFFLFLDFNPFNSSEGEAFSPGIIDFELRSLPGDIIIWDAHFGAVGGKTNIEHLLNSNQLMHLNVFRPDVPFTVFGGNNYEIHVFQKTLPPIDDIAFSKTSSRLFQQFEICSDEEFDLVYFNSFTSTYDERFKHLIRSFPDGEQGLVLNRTNPWFSLFEDQFSRLADEKSLFFYCSFDIFPENFDKNSDELIFVFSTHNKRSMVSYQPTYFRLKEPGENQWETIFHSFEVDDHDPQMRTKLYIWYNGNGNIVLDNPLLIRKNLK